MVRDLKAAFKMIIEEASWMDDDTRKSALEKVIEYHFHISDIVSQITGN